MTVKTHLRDESDLNHEDHGCFACGRDAHYWSQNENGGKNDPPLGGSVFHCQAHRTRGRLLALTTTPNGWAREWESDISAERVEQQLTHLFNAHIEAVEPGTSNTKRLNLLHQADIVQKRMAQVEKQLDDSSPIKKHLTELRLARVAVRDMVDASMMALLGVRGCIMMGAI